MVIWVAVPLAIGTIRIACRDIHCKPESATSCELTISFRMPSVSQFVPEKVSRASWREVMPSVTHEAPIELIRQHPDLAVELLRAISDVDLPSEIAVSLAPTW